MNNGNNVLPPVPWHKYNFVYLGGHVHEDLRVGGPYEPVEPYSALELNTGTPRSYMVYQLPEDGYMPPIVLDGTLTPSFTAILRYHHDNPIEVDRIRNWITQNMQYCRDILVASYPTSGTTEEEINAMSQVVQSFIGNRIRSIGFTHDPQNTQGPCLTKLLQKYAQLMPRHEPTPPPPTTQVYRFAYVGGSLTADFNNAGNIAGGPILRLHNSVILRDGTQSIIQMELRQVVETGIPTAWTDANENGILPQVGAIVKLSGTSSSDSTRSVEWIRQNVARCSKIFVVVYPNAVMAESDNILLNQLNRQNVGKFQVFVLEPHAQDGSLPTMNRVAELIRNTLG